MLARQLIIALLLGSLATGCAIRQLKSVGSIPDLVDVFIEPHELELPPPEFDPTLKPFIGQFVADAHVRGVNITDESVSMLRKFVYVDRLSVPQSGKVIAACSRFHSWEITATERKKVRWNIIEVLRKESQDYTEGDPKRLKELAYHELFHCFLNKGHLPRGVPGIMAPALSKGSDRIYTDWKGLVDEMFTKEYIDLIPDASD